MVKDLPDIDTALRRICELTVNIEQLNGELTLEINALKEQKRSAVEKLVTEKTYLEQQITLFCEDNKALFAQKRSKEFTFGEIGYRISKSVSVPRVKTKLEALITAIKSYGLKDCLSYTENVNKEALAELDDTDLARLGLKRIVKDNFRITPRIEALDTRANYEKIN